MKQNKAPVLAALEALKDSFPQVNTYDSMDDFYHAAEAHKKARADLQKWADDVPDCSVYTHNNCSEGEWLYDVAKHLLKGIKNK